mgnify:CR=1 FL=1|tara:strand:+ start:834 stop:1019 length:186 start_codon:yes stop_codon:yes gene_type:complete
MLKPQEITNLKYITVDDVSNKWVAGTQGDKILTFNVDGKRDEVREVMQRVENGELTIQDAD